MVNTKLQHLMQTLDSAESDRLENLIQQIALQGGDKVSDTDLLAALAQDSSAKPARSAKSRNARPALSRELINWLQNALVFARLELGQPHIDRTALIRALPHSLLSAPGSQRMIAPNQPKAFTPGEMPSPASATDQPHRSRLGTPCSTASPGHARRIPELPAHAGMRLKKTHHGFSGVVKSPAGGRYLPREKGPAVLVVVANSDRDAATLAGALSDVLHRPLEIDLPGLKRLVTPVMGAPLQSQNAHSEDSPPYLVHLLELQSDFTKPAASPEVRRYFPTTALILSAHSSGQLRRSLREGAQDPSLLNDINNLIANKRPGIGPITFFAAAYPLRRAGLQQLIALKLAQFSEQIGRRGIHLTHGQQLLRHLADQCLQAPGCTNIVAQLLEQHVAPFVLDKLLAEDVRGAVPTSMHIDVAGNGRLSCEIH